MLISTWEQPSLARVALAGSGVLYFWLVASSAAAMDQLAVFDLETLKQRGLDTRVAEYFQQAPRFEPGARQIDLKVNGKPRGTVNARFDASGELCFDDALLEDAGLVAPPSVYLLSSGCYAFRSAYPGSQIALLPAAQAVALVLPNEALRREDGYAAGYVNGGWGGVFNYDALGMQMQFGGESREFYSAITDIGFNANDWIVRSRQSFTQVQGRRQFQSLYSYAQTTLVSRAATLQVGQVNLLNSVLAGVAMTGVQWAPELALRNAGSNMTTVRGIAQGQARVEVRQAGALIYTTLVPPGPFNLSDVKVLNGGADLYVRVIEDSGEERESIVPAIELGQPGQGVSGWTFGAGQVRAFGRFETRTPWVLSAGNGWNLSSRSQLTSGALVSQQNYFAAGVGLDHLLSPRWALGIKHSASTWGDAGRQGQQLAIGVRTRWPGGLSAGINLSHRSEGYHELQETLSGYDYGESGRNQYGVTLGWSDGGWGSFNLGYSQANAPSGHQSRFLMAGWSHRFRGVTLSANAERSTYREVERDPFENRLRTRDTAFYLSLTAPLGEAGRVGGYARRSGDTTRLGATWSERVSDRLAYRLDLERQPGAPQQGMGGDLSWSGNDTRVNLGYSRTANASETFSGRISGGVALGQDIVFSPLPLGDTFAIATVGDLPDVRIDTPSGPVWTDHRGRAVIPQLRAYSESRVQVATQTLPRQVDLHNGHRQLRAGRGSVQRLEFNVATTRRALLTVKTSLGRFPRKGAAVVDTEGNYLTAVAAHGKVFLNDVPASGGLQVFLSEQESCFLKFELPQVPPAEAYFEQLDATCEAGALHET